MALFPSSTTNSLVPEEEERYRITTGEWKDAERSGPFRNPKVEQIPAKVETVEVV